MPGAIAGRKVLFFLGAGASRGAGSTAPAQGGARVPSPTQSEFWDVFLRFCPTGSNRRLIQSFLFRYFLGYIRVPARLSSVDRRRALRHVDVEEVFTFLSERVRAPSTSPQFRSYALRIWRALLAEVGQVFRRFEPTYRSRAIYRSLLAHHVRARDAVVSFNWDTVFERSLPKTQRWHYEGLDHQARSLRILKPHGSVNWQLGDPITISDRPEVPVIVAPTHLKFVETTPAADSSSHLGYLDQSQEIQAIWSEMETQMRQAKALVFIGYSFPVADLYFSSVLRSVLALRDRPPALVLVNPDATSIRARLEARFSLGAVVTYFDLETYVRSTRSAVLGILGL